MSFQKKSQGFTLIEVLVSLLLSSVAILCFYTLQIKDRQLFTEGLIENEAQIQVLNIRELILADSFKINPQQILALTKTSEAFKAEIRTPASSQFLLHTAWISHLNQEHEIFFSLSLLA